MKRLYAVIACAAIWSAACAADAEPEFCYEFHPDQTCTLVSANCRGDVSLPATVFSDGVEYTLTAIGPEAFIDSRMTSLQLPPDIVRIGDDAFRRCYFLKKVSVASLESWMNISFANEFATPLTGYNPLYIGDTLLSQLDVPAGVTEIKPYAFFNCSSLESAGLGGIESIGAHAFDGCENLASVDFASGLEKIGDWAFSICCHLSAVSLPATVSSVGEGAFYGCSTLSDISLPNSMRVIPMLCFAGCSAIENLDFLPESIIGVGDLAFHFCSGLRTANLGASVSFIGDEAFRECSSLYSATVSRPDATLGDFVFADCGQLGNVELPEAMTVIPTGTFYGCASLPTVNLPSGIEEISNYAFAGCYSLRYLTLPQGLRHIGTAAMHACGSIKRIEFPVSMESINAEAFSQCLGLQQIHVRSAVPFRISYFSFDWQADREAEVYVPAASYDLYKADTHGWGNFDHLIGLEEYNPDTRLRIKWGDVSVGRSVAYGSRLTMNVTRSDGSLPERVSFNGTPLTVSESDGSVTTPPVTDNSVLEIE